MIRADLNLRTGQYKNLEIMRIISSRATLYRTTMNNQDRVIKVYNKSNNGEQKRAMYLNQHLLPRVKKYVKKQSYLETTMLKDFPVDFGSINIDGENAKCTVYEYIPGFDLYDRSQMQLRLTRMDKSKIPFQEFIKVSYHLASTIMMLHKFEFIHGDLAPTNIRMSNGGSKLELTIMDFDGSGYVSDGKDSKKDVAPIIKGTDGIPGFFSPSEWHKNRVHRETDNWFLAMILFHIITRGFTPFFFLKFADLSNTALRRGFLSMKEQRWPPSKEQLIKFLPPSCIDESSLNAETLDKLEKLLSKVFGSSALFFRTFGLGYANLRNRTTSSKLASALHRTMKDLNIK